MKDSKLAGDMADSGSDDDDDESLNENYLESKMRIDQYGEDSSVENRDDNQVGRWEDLQRILTNITIEINFIKKNILPLGL